MNFNIVFTAQFYKDIKKLLKKYPSLKKEMMELQEMIINNPVLGTPLGQDCYKIRVAIKSKRKGKSGGARVITNVKIIANTVYLLSIYDKSEKEDFTDQELNNWLSDI
jgi:mRNA-degrading endonuclease RelE of RelBE toxin-antitoxin system